MSAPLNNKNARKPDDERASSFLHIQCRRADKSQWVTAAQSAPDKKTRKLAAWATAQLNAAAKKSAHRGKS